MRAPLGPLRGPVEVVLGWHAAAGDPLLDESTVPRGHGDPVLIVSGFGAPPPATLPLRRFLSGIGYEPRLAPVRNGIDCSERSAQAVERELVALTEEHGRPAILLAHSRGGLFAWVVARRRRAATAGLIALGTPFELLALRPMVKASMVVLAAAGGLGVPNVIRFSCVSGACCERFRADFEAAWPADLPFFSIYSKEDRTVVWRACLDPTARCVEVAGSHAAMLVRADAFRAIADAASEISSRSRSRPARRPRRRAQRQ
jgi:triacylglycerol lipase